MKQKPRSRNPAIYIILACTGCIGLPILLCCGLFLTGTTAAVIAERSKVSETQTETFSLTDVERPIKVSIENGNGIINVVGESGLEEIEAEYKITGRSFNKSRAQDAVDSVSIVIEDDLTSDGELKISVTSNDVDFEGLMPLIRNVDITVRVPTETDIDLETSNGRITVDNVTAERISQINTSNGDITITDSVFGGDFEVSTSNGSVKLQDVTTERNLSLTTSNGRVDLTELAAMGGFVIETSNGTINFRGTIGGDDTYRLDTSNGDVIVEIDREIPPFRLDVELQNGTLNNNLRLTDDSQENQTGIKGYYNGGSRDSPDNRGELPELIIETSNGDITLNAR